MFRTTRLLLSVSLALAPSLWAADLPIGFERHPVSDPPKWTGSISWSLDASELIAVDVKRGSLRLYSPKDGSFRREITSLDGLEGEFKPAILQRFGDVLILENGDGHLVWLNSNWGIEKQVKLVPLVDGGGQTVGSVWGWAPAGPDAVVTFSDVQLPNPTDPHNDWFSAFLRIQTEPPHDFKILDQTVDLGDPGRKLYLTLGHKYFTSVSDRAVYLAMTGQPRLEEWTSKPNKEGNTRDLASLMPDDFRSRDVPWDSFGSSIEKYEYIEAHSELVVGLYAVPKEEQVYMLRRRPSTAGTEWSLIPVEMKATADKQDISEPFVLPVVARQLIVAPGERWGFLEVREPIRRFGNLGSMTLLIGSHTAMTEAAK